MCSVILTYVNEFLDVSDFEVPEDGCIVEIGEAGHVLAHVELGRVHLGHLVLLELLDLQGEENMCALSY